MSVKMRQMVERRIASRLVRDAVRAGYQLSIDYGDGEMGPFSTVEAIKGVMFQGDDDRVYYYKNGTRVGWVWLVYGNDGWDVISDYTTNLASVVEPACEFSRRFE